MVKSRKSLGKGIVNSSCHICPVFDVLRWRRQCPACPAVALARWRRSVVSPANHPTHAISAPIADRLTDTGPGQESPTGRSPRQSLQLVAGRGGGRCPSTSVSSSWIGRIWPSRSARCGQVPIGRRGLARRLDAAASRWPCQLAGAGSYTSSNARFGAPWPRAHCGPSGGDGRDCDAPDQPGARTRLR